MQIITCLLLFMFLSFNAGWLSRSIWSFQNDQRHSQYKVAFENLIKWLMIARIKIPKPIKGYVNHVCGIWGMIYREDADFDNDTDDELSDS